MDNRYLPVLGMAAGLLNAPQGQARGFGGALSAGLLGGMQGMQFAQQQEDDARTGRLRELQMTLAVRQMQKAEAEAQQRQAAFIQATAGMDPRQAALLQAGGPEAFTSYVQNQLAPPKPPTTRTINQGGMEVTQEWGDGGWTEIGRGSRWEPQQPREQPEMWSILDPARAKAAGLPEGGVYQVSSRGQVRALDGGSQTETWETLSPEEVAQLGFAPGTVATRSNRGALQVEQQPKGGGLDVQFTPGGDLASISLGGVPQVGKGTVGLTTPTATEVQKELIGLQDQSARLDEIGKKFDPEYLKVGPRIGNALTATQERLGMEVSPEAQADLGNFTSFRSDAIANLNQILKEQSGAAVTTQEYERLQAALPQAGTGIMDGDSPTQFQAKLKATTQRLKMANARKAYLLSKGIPFDIQAGNTGGVSLENMPEIIDGEGERIEQDLIQQGATPEQAEAQAAQQLKQMFGL